MALYLVLGEEDSRCLTTVGGVFRYKLAVSTWTKLNIIIYMSAVMIIALVIHRCQDHEPICNVNTFK